MHANIISARNVIFDYPSKRALFGVNIDVPKGATLALVGPNGAGKSTLMRVIAGIEAPVAGDVIVDGVNVLEAPRTAHTKLGYLADFFGLYDELTVTQCLRHAASIRAVPRDRIDAAIVRGATRLGIHDRLHEQAGHLSRGLKQRLAIAQALIHEPTVLMLDEPAAGLDPEARASLSDLFRQLRAEGMTLLVSSHILAELEEYCTHMLAIRDGRVADFVAVSTWQSGVAAGTSPTRTLRITHLSSSDVVSDVLAREQATVIETPSPPANESAAQTIVVELAGGADAAAKLLASLVTAGVRVCEYAVVRETLQSSYLRSAAMASQSKEAGVKL
jgi:ABC-2 type transport system ATP-binding protein